MRTEREIAVLRSEDEIDATIAAANVARIGAAQRKRLRSKWNTRFASWFENLETIQAIADRAANVGVSGGKRQSLVGLMPGEWDVRSGEALDRKDTVLRWLDQNAHRLPGLGIDQYDRNSPHRRRRGPSLQKCFGLRLIQFVGSRNEARLTLAYDGADARIGKDRPLNCESFFGRHRG